MVTKFNIGDTVWFIKENSVKCGKIRSIDIDASKRIAYHIPSERDNGWGYYPEDKLFATQTDALVSIMNNRPKWRQAGDTVWFISNDHQIISGEIVTTTIDHQHTAYRIQYYSVINSYYASTDKEHSEVFSSFDKAWEHLKKINNK